MSKKTKTELEKTIDTIYKALMAHEIELGDLYKYMADFSRYLQFITGDTKTFNEKTLKRFIEMNLILYTFDPDGRVMISDTAYDRCMRKYCHQGHMQITTTDYEPTVKVDATKWEILPHEHREMVGSITKSYDIDKMVNVLGLAKKNHIFIRYHIAPKYDGNSVCMNCKNGEVKSATTRKDGKGGQNILPVLKNAENFYEVQKFLLENRPVALKCEILVSTANYEKVKHLYANRRSAASGITSSPKNIKLGYALTIKPLLAKYITEDGPQYVYLADKFGLCGVDEPKDLGKPSSNLDAYMIKDMLEKCKNTSYPFRVDGVVVYAELNNPQLYSIDAMDTSLAYKVNSENGETEVLGGYISIGRTGLATPMISVDPVDVNETVVTDVSLSNIKKAKKLGLHIGDRVIIESSGDVIPMIKEVVKRSKKGEPVKFEELCPYCNKRLEMVSAKKAKSLGDGIFDDDKESLTLKCTNPSCPRILAGRLTNFCEKMGMEGFSDTSFLSMIHEDAIHSFIDLVSIALDEIERTNFVRTMAGVDGWGENNIADFIDEVVSIFETPVKEDVFFGALGIPNVSLNKASVIVREISVKKMLKLIEDKDYHKFIDALSDIKGIGPGTARAVYDYLYQYFKDIRAAYNACEIIPFIETLGSYACTGFSNSEKAEIQELLAARNYSLDSLTKKSLGLICKSTALTTGKMEKAQKYGIPIMTYEEFLRKF